MIWRGKKPKWQRRRITAKTANTLGANEEGQVCKKSSKNQKKEKKLCRREVKKGEKFSTKELILWRLKKFRFLLPNFFPPFIPYLYVSITWEVRARLFCFVLIPMFNAQQKVKNNYMPFNCSLRNLKFKLRTDSKCMTMFTQMHQKKCEKDDYLISCWKISQSCALHCVGLIFVMHQFPFRFASLCFLLLSSFAWIGWKQKTISRQNNNNNNTVDFVNIFLIRIFFVAFSGVLIKQTEFCDHPS